MGGRAPAPRRPRERRHARRRTEGARVRRRRHRARTHRAHVLRARSDRDRPRDDHGARLGVAALGGGAAAAVPARRLHGDLPRPGRLAGGDPDRIAIVREMIMAPDSASRRSAVARLLPFQRDDFMGIFRAMDGLPVTIRLLDPPLHEFLPNHQEYKALIEERSRLEALGINAERQAKIEHMIATVEKLREANPMLGHRGCRLGITHPEIYGMQVRAIMEAACSVTEQGGRVEPEIMMPLTGTVGEMKLTYEQTKRIADGVAAETGVAVKYSIGTMIEVPRAALIADQIAQHAEFFSFGTNDLTQMTFGYSRDDVAKFLPDYLQKGLVPADPFSVLDQEGVGELVQLGIERGRRTRPDLKVGI